MLLYGWIFKFKYTYMLLSTKARINIQLTVNKNMENIFMKLKIKIIFSLYRSIETPTPFACFKIISNQHRFSINTIIKNSKCTLLPLTDRWYLSTGSTFSSYEYMLVYTEYTFKTKNLITGSLHSPGTHANSKAINGLPVNDELIHAER